MKLIDRYIVKQFLLTALFSLVAVTVIFVVIDAMEKLDNFIDRQATTQVVALYYLYFIPEIIKLITPVAMLLASLFVTARLSTQNELTALKACGVSLYRLMAPYIIVALIVTAGSIYFNGWIVPVANQAKLAIERRYLGTGGGMHATSTDLYLQDSPTRIISLGFYDDGRASAQRVSLQEFSDTNLTVVTGRIDATGMSWDSTARSWIMRTGTQRWFTGGRERMERFVTRTAGGLHFTPDDLRKKQEKPDAMDYYTLQAFIENQQRAGQDVNRWLVDFYSKISFPFATVIVVLFGVPFSSVKRRGGVGVQLGISLLICFIYLIFMKVSQVFGYNGDVNPLLTAWMANILFFAAAVAVMLRVKK
jgi:lipopolysaccharide export system permease protein